MHSNYPFCLLIQSKGSLLLSILSMTSQWYIWISPWPNCSNMLNHTQLTTLCSVALSRNVTFRTRNYDLILFVCLVTNLSPEPFWNSNEKFISIGVTLESLWQAQWRAIDTLIPARMGCYVASNTPGYSPLVYLLPISQLIHHSSKPIWFTKLFTLF